MNQRMQCLGLLLLAMLCLGCRPEIEARDAETHSPGDSVTMGSDQVSGKVEELVFKGTGATSEIVALLESESLMDQEVAILAADQIGLKDKEVIELIGKQLSSRRIPLNIRLNAVAAIKHGGDAAIPHLFKALESPREDEFAKAIAEALSESRINSSHETQLFAAVANVTIAQKNSLRLAPGAFASSQTTVQNSRGEVLSSQSSRIGPSNLSAGLGDSYERWGEVIKVLEEIQAANGFEVRSNSEDE